MGESLVDPDWLFVKGADWPKRARSSHVRHASVISYIANQIYPTKMVPGPLRPLPGIRLWKWNNHQNLCDINATNMQKYWTKYELMQKLGETSFLKGKQSILHHWHLSSGLSWTSENQMKFEWVHVQNKQMLMGLCLRRWKLLLICYTYRYMYLITDNQIMLTSVENFRKKKRIINTEIRTICTKVVLVRYNPLQENHIHEMQAWDIASTVGHRLYTWRCSAGILLCS